MRWRAPRGEDVPERERDRARQRERVREGERERERERENGGETKENIEWDTSSLRLQPALRLAVVIFTGGGGEAGFCPRVLHAMDKVHPDVVLTAIWAFQESAQWRGLKRWGLWLWLGLT